MTNGEKFKSVFGFGVDGSRVIAVNSTWWDCDFQIRKPKTNADKMRNTTDEELAELFTANACELICGSPMFCNGNCKQKFLEWLKQEAKQ